MTPYPKSPPLIEAPKKSVRVQGNVLLDNSLTILKLSYTFSNVLDNSEKYLGPQICTILDLLLFSREKRSVAHHSGLVNQVVTTALTIDLHTKQEDSINSFLKVYLARVL